MCRSRRSIGGRPCRRRRKRTSNADSSRYHESSRDAATRECRRDRTTRCGPEKRRRSRCARLRLARIAAANPALNAFHTVAADQALAQAAALDGRRADWDRMPLVGVPIALKDNLCTRGPDDDRRLAHPRALRSALQRDRRRSARRRRRRHRRQDQLRRVRDGIVDRELRVRTDAQPVGARPDARADRAADRRPRSRRAWCRSRSDPIRADRSASPPRSAASSASSRPTAGSRATACSPSPRHSIRSDRSPPRWPTPRCACR